jgi:rhodanese-related sulfurtransferase
MVYRLLLATGRRFKGLYEEMIRACGLLLLSFLVGVIINKIKTNPLPFVYQTKADRVYSSAERFSVNTQTSEFPVSLGRSLSFVEFRAFVIQHLGTVLDVRPSFFYKMGHVPGALSLPCDDFQASYTQLGSQFKADKSIAIAVYCTGGGCEDGSIVQQALLKMGYSDVSIFPGGWEEWITSGLPQEKAQ